jgi:tetratricopeptide (TPR) repeat protein
MAQNGGSIIPEALTKRLDELKRQTDEKETSRIDDLVSSKIKEFTETRNKDFIAQHKQNLQTAENIRKQMESDLFEGEKIIKLKLQEEQRKIIEIRKRELEEKKRREEEEKKRREEEEKQRFEEEKRRQLEEEANRVEEEKRRKAEEELRRLDEERLRREEETRREEEEREQRIQVMLQQAEMHFDKGEYDLALIEAAKALINDPNHAEALALREKIKEIQQPVQPAADNQTEPPKIKEVEDTVGTENEKVIRRPGPNFPELPRRKIGKRSLLIAAVSVIIFVVLIMILRLGQKIFEQAPTIAVLPLTSSSGILEDDILGYALADDINLRLSAVKDLRVMGNASVITLKNTVSNPNKSIQQAGFNYILSGTISRTGDSRIIDLRLIDSSNSIIYETHLAKEPNNFNQIVPEICKELVSELKIKVENDLLSHLPTFDQTAYLMYLRGLELLNRKTFASYNNAQELFDQAALSDNNFAEAFVASAFVSISKIENNWEVSPEEIQKAEDKLQRALTAFPKLATAKRNIGLLHAYVRNFKNAGNELNNAIELAPNNSENYFAIAKLYNRIGKYNDAKDALVRAINLDPYNLELVELFAQTYQLLGNYADAYATYEKIMPLVSDSSSFILNYTADAILFDSDLKINSTQKLVNILENRLSINVKDYITMYKLGRTYQLIGKNSEAAPIFDKALELMAKQLESDPGNPEISVYMALVYTRLGKFSDAIKYAKRSLSADTKNANINYKIARMYAIQKNDSLAFGYLEESLNIYYNLNEILDIDFFNVRTKPEFLNTIKLKDK